MDPGGGRKRLDAVGYWLNFDRQPSADKLRSAGVTFVEQWQPAAAWTEAFRGFRDAGIIF